MERRKLFSSGRARRSLFTDFASSSTRRKIFCDPENMPEPDHTVVCQDCGYEVQTAASDTYLVCPNCGGHRFNQKQPEGRQKKFSDSGILSDGRRSLFQGSYSGNRVVLGGNYPLSRDFSDSTDSTDEFLDQFSGKTLTYSELQKEFTERGINETPEEMINSGYACETPDGKVCFSECSGIQRKLFSKLVISVTKELELEPVDSREALIQKLVDAHRLPEKSIILVKKAHSLPVGPDTSVNQGDDYIKDSGIENDLRLEYGGKTLPLLEFTNILHDQYNDAPVDIIDKLVSSGVIHIDGSQVEVNK
jgi:DNA-directed RNA polymerase subunit RPC12/RpoP